MAAGGDGDNNSEKAKDFSSKAQADIKPGCQIWCKTCFSEEFNGEVMAYDRETRALIIKSISTAKGAKKTAVDINLINLNNVGESNFRIVSRAKGEPPPVPEYDHDKLAKRLRNNVTGKAKAVDTIGIDVSREAQMLFDSIYRIMSDCQWNGHNIVVMDEVTISPPYKPDNCTCIGKRKDSLDRIRKMVERFYKEKQKSGEQKVSF